MLDDKKELWPGWETVKIIGRGSFGAVYEIERDVFGHKEKAALKVITIPQSDSDIEEMYDSGYDEASVTATFKSHLESIVNEYTLMREMNGAANVVNCDDFRIVPHDGNIGWDIFIKMELLTPLTKALPKQPSDAQVIQIAKDMCGALILCKKYGIIHRDIKPQNIFVSKNGDYKLGDFGIAKTIEKTSGGTKIGTYKYMAPEVYNNQPYNLTADIYSLGLVLHWMLNERRSPFMPLPPAPAIATQEDEARAKRFKGTPIPAPAHGSEELKKIILKACAYSSKDRFQSAEEMLKALNRLDGSSWNLTASASDVQQDEQTIDDGTSGGWNTKSGTSSKTSADTSQAGAETVGKFNLGKTVEQEKPGEAIKPKKKTGLVWGIMGGLALFAVLLFSLTLDKEAAVDINNSRFEIGDVVRFGSIEQDNNLSNGDEEIEWIVIDKRNGEAVLISKYILFFRPYNETEAKVNWETCSLREWLNSSFINSAFTTDERARIAPTTIDVSGEISDFISILSIEELEDIYGLSDGNRVSNRLDSYATQYATIEAGYGNFAGPYVWWGRTESSSDMGRYIRATNGHVSSTPTSVNSMCGVRPAIRVYEEPVDESQVIASPIATTNGNDEAFAAAQALAREYGTKRFLAAGDNFTIGIKPDGTCIATGRDYPDVSNWTGIVALTADRNTVAGLRADGTVLCSEYYIDVSNWERITQIDYFTFEFNQHIVGLTAEGTVVASGTNHFGECDVNEWSNIVDVAAGSTHTIGLRSDGTVVACGNNAYGQCNVSEWKRIVDIDASRYATYGLTADGEVLVAGFYEDEYGSCVPDVPQWDNVVAIIASNEAGSANDFVIGICRDGSIVSNRWGYLNDGDLESFTDVQSVAVASWGYTVCMDSQGHVRDVGWDGDGTRQLNSWPILKTN